jgi:hypothetical protein
MNIEAELREPLDVATSTTAEIHDRGSSKPPGELLGLALQPIVPPLRSEGRSVLS